MSSFAQTDVDRQAQNLPIKSIIKDAAASKHVGANSGESSCTNHNAIAIMRRNVCGPLNRRAIIFTARSGSLWLFPGCHLPVTMKLRCLRVQESQVRLSKSVQPKNPRHRCDARTPHATAAPARCSRPTPAGASRAAAGAVDIKTWHPRHDGGEYILDVARHLDRYRLCSEAGRSGRSHRWLAAVLNFRPSVLN
jgi:hypothetical protein